MDGYALSHTLVLAHCRIPRSQDQPRIRALILTLKVAFSAIFWTMLSSTTTFGYGSLRQKATWPPEGLPWGDLCTHNPLTEGVQGLELSAEEFTAVSEQRRLRKNDELSPNSRSLQRASMPAPAPAPQGALSPFRRRIDFRAMALAIDTLWNAMTAALVWV